MAFTAEFVTTSKVLTGDQWGTGGRIEEYRVGSIRANGCERRMSQTWTISAGVSAQAIALGPLGVSAPGAVLFFQASDRVDVRTQTAADTVFLSGVLQLLMGGNVSALFVTTGDNPTTIRAFLVGGSNVSLTASLPLS